MKTTNLQYILDYIKNLLQHNPSPFGVNGVEFIIINHVVKVKVDTDYIYCPYMNKNVLEARKMVDINYDVAIQDIKQNIMYIQQQITEYEFVDTTNLELLQLQLKKQQYFERLIILHNEINKSSKLSSIKKTESEVAISNRLQYIKDEEFDIAKNREYLIGLTIKYLIEEINKQIKVLEQYKAKWEKELSDLGFVIAKPILAKQAQVMLPDKSQDLIEEQKDIIKKDIMSITKEIKSLSETKQFVENSEEIDFIDQQIRQYQSDKFTLEQQLKALEIKIVPSDEEQKVSISAREYKPVSSPQISIEDLGTELLIKKTELENVLDTIRQVSDVKQQQQLNKQKEQIEIDIQKLKEIIKQQKKPVIPLKTTIECSVCTFQNPLDSKQCQICDTQLPKQGGAVNYKTKYLKYKSKNRNF